ncbi:MAG: TonB-dependent receptor [Sphingobium sp.]
MKTRALFTALSVGTMLATPAWAADESGSGDIIVTARKRVETALDVPVSITAYSAQQIDRQDLTSIEKVSARTPQLVVGRAANGSGAQLTLRGIGSSSTSIGIEPSVATIVDGVYYGHGRMVSEGLFDMARVEVLNGPQALFFGKNATAGALSFTTADPGDKLEALARVGYEFNARNVVGEGFISTPLTDTLGIRVAVRASKMYGGYIDNKAEDASFTSTDIVTGAQRTYVSPGGHGALPGERELMGRITLKWKPSSRLTGTLKLSGNRNIVDNANWNAIVFACPTGNSALDPGLACRRDFTVYQHDIPAEIAATLPYARDGGLYNRYSSYSATGTIEYELADNVQLTSVNNYNWNRNRFAGTSSYLSRTISPTTWSTESSTYHAFSSELRLLTSFDGPLNLMIGGLYQSTDRKFTQYAAGAGAENSAASPENRYVSFSKNSATQGETLSGFGQVIWKVVPTVELTGGVRYTHETKDSYFLHPYVSPRSRAIWVEGQTVTADQTFTNWSPEATISWRPQPNLNIYAAYKTGYKSGGFSNSGIYSATGSIDDFTFEPEKARGFEAGIKAALFDRSLQIALGLYRYRFSNLQVDFFNSPIFAYSTINAGAAVTKGVEFSLNWLPQAVPGLDLRGSVNYNRARYRDFQAPCYVGQTPAGGCSITTAGGALYQDLSGQPTAAAPLWTAAAGFGYQLPLSGGWTLGVDADARYSASYIMSGFGNPLSRQPKFVTLDASARVRSGDERWEFAIIGKNLTNRFILGGVYDAGSTGRGTGTAAGVLGDQVGYVQTPRTVQAQISWRY